MSRVLRPRRIAAVLVALALVASGATTVPADSTLVVADADSGERLLEVPVDNGTEVVLEYTHSVEKTPVRDVYVVDGRDLRMTRMVFDSYGAGLPARADVERTEDGLVTRIDRSYERLRVSPGSIANHTLRVGDERYDLVALADGNDVVLFVVDRGVVDGLASAVDSLSERDADARIADTI